jgi:hypothetical protein
MHFYFFIKTKYQQLKDMAPDRRVDNKYNIIDIILNNAINVEAASKFCTSNIEITPVNGVEKPETANLNSVHLQNLLYLLTDEFTLVHLTQNRQLITTDRSTHSLGASA